MPPPPVPTKAISPRPLRAAPIRSRHPARRRTASILPFLVPTSFRRPGAGRDPLLSRSIVGHLDAGLAGMTITTTRLTSRSGSQASPLRPRRRLEAEAASEDGGSVRRRFGLYGLLGLTSRSTISTQVC